MRRMRLKHAYIDNQFTESPLRDEAPFPMVWDEGAGSVIEYVIDSLETAVSGPFTGLVIATATIKKNGALGHVAEDEIEVVDHSGCVFDLADMEGYTGWAILGDGYLSLDAGASSGDLAPIHYAACNRCCAPDTGIYASLE